MNAKEYTSTVLIITHDGTETVTGVVTVIRDDPHYLTLVLWDQSKISIAHSLVTRIVSTRNYF